MCCGNTDSAAHKREKRWPGKSGKLEWHLPLTVENWLLTSLNMSRIRSNRICFTLNNYEESDLDLFLQLKEQDDNGKAKVCGFDVVYCVVGEEIGEQGTRHLQGFIHLQMDNAKGGIRFWKNAFKFSQAAHYENARGDDAQNQKYCTKEGIFIEMGTPSDSRSTKQRIFEMAKIDLEEAVKIDYDIGIRCYFQLKAINADFKPKKELTHCITELRPWQTEAMERLRNQATRQILFVIDPEGGKGKSELAKYILKNHVAFFSQGKY